MKARAKLRIALSTLSVIFAIVACTNGSLGLMMASVTCWIALGISLTVKRDIDL